MLLLFVLLLFLFHYLYAIIIIPIGYLLVLFIIYDFKGYINLKKNNFLKLMREKEK